MARNTITKKEIANRIQLTVNKLTDNLVYSAINYSKTL